MATELFELLGPDFDGPLHFIGHSLGAAVNANAVAKLRELRESDSTYVVHQFTLLDAPVDISVAGISNDGATITFPPAYFYELLDPSQVKYVENFYSDGVGAFNPITFEGNPLAVGVGGPLPGAGPEGSQYVTCGQITKCGHGEVWAEAYTDIVRGAATAETTWVSPAKPGGFVPPLLWSPPGHETVVPAYQFGGDPSTEGFEAILGGVELMPNGFRLLSQSPAAIAYHFGDIADFDMIRFEFNFESVFSNDWLEVLINGLSVFEYRPFGPMEHYLEVVLSAPSGYGFGDTIVWYLHSDTPGTSVNVANLRFTRLQSASIDVEEPMLPDFLRFQPSVGTRRSLCSLARPYGLWRTLWPWRFGDQVPCVCAEKRCFRDTALHTTDLCEKTIVKSDR